MLTFQNEPPDDPRGVSLPLKRCPTVKQVMGIITCDQMLCCPTHYYGGRTIPCTGEDCPAHKDGVPWRWHSYVSAWVPYQKLHILFESTAKASEPFKLYRLAHGTLRGCQYVAKRCTSAANSRVIIETKPADIEQLTLPNEPNVLQALSIIWNIPLSEMEVSGTTKDVARIRLADQAQSVANKINNRLTQYSEPQERKPA